MSKPITILELAKYRGAKPTEDGEGINGSEFERVNLPIMGGCMCGTTVAAYNAYPGKNGYLHCRDCIGGGGWDSVEDANRDIFDGIMPVAI